MSPPVQLIVWHNGENFYMKEKRIISCVLGSTLLFTGCTQVAQKPSLEEAGIATATTAVTTTEEIPENITTDPPVETLTLSVPTINRMDADLTLEAEDAAIPQGCSIAVLPRLGYSGTGYMQSLSTEYDSELNLDATIPATQHYDMTITAGSDDGAKCAISVGGERVFTLQLEGAENFVRVTVPGIFIAEGNQTISIKCIEGNADIDCVELVNNTSLYEESEEISKTPINKNATENTKKLYSFLQENYGKSMVTGQWVSGKENTELDTIFDSTGAYPVIRFADMGNYTNNSDDNANATAINDSILWAEDGGAVGLTWYWAAPTGSSSCYAEDCSFQLSDAVTDVDIATKTPQELSKLLEQGEISEETYALITDIDLVSTELKKLQTKDIPVLWRPLPEAGGGWYWWGASGVDDYRWLWNLLYQRMTEYHELNNLIWIWNGQSSSFTVDASTYDIASVDLYVDESETFGSRYEQYVAMRNIVGNKMLAISESSGLPDINQLFRDNAIWSFSALWYDPYLSDYVTTDDLVQLYHSEGTLTRNDYILYCATN